MSADWSAFGGRTSKTSTAFQPVAWPRPDRPPIWGRSKPPTGRRLAGFRAGETPIPDRAAFDRFLRATDTTAFLVLKDGKLRHEAYDNGYGPTRLCKAFSMSKSVLSAMFGIAASEGMISEAAKVGDFLTDLPHRELADIRLGALLDCTSGFAYRRGNAPWKEQPRMYYTTDVRRLVSGMRPAHAQGLRFTEEDLSPLVLGVVLEAALRRTRKDDTLSDFAARRLWGPMGAEADALWVTDRASGGFEKVESGLAARARDLARFGQLYLDRGVAGGRQIVPTAWIDRCTTAPPKGQPNRFTDGFLSAFWWGDPDRAGAPAYYANGHFGQRIYVDPQKQLVLVRLGSSMGGQNWTKVLRALAQSWAD